MNPSAGRLERYADRVVLHAVPAGAEADLKPPAGKNVEAGQILGHDGRMTQPGVEHERQDT